MPLQKVMHHSRQVQQVGTGTHRCCSPRDIADVIFEREVKPMHLQPLAQHDQCLHSLMQREMTLMGLFEQRMLQRIFIFEMRLQI